MKHDPFPCWAGPLKGHFINSILRHWFLAAPMAGNHVSPFQDHFVVMGVARSSIRNTKDSVYPHSHDIVSISGPYLLQVAYWFSHE